MSNENETECANNGTDSATVENIEAQPTGAASAETSDASLVITSSNDLQVDATAASEEEAETTTPPRAELQARLALLAAQLAEIAEEPPGVGVSGQEHNTDSEGDEMEVII